MEINQDLAEEAKFELHGRILRCPLGENPEDCPLHEIRKLPLEDRIAWLESLTNEELIDLYAQHNKCMEGKLEKQEG